jgi:predicted hydrocarbon binding protein
MRIRDILRLFRMLKELRFDSDKGEIKSEYGIRYILFSSDMISAIEDSLRDIVGKDAARGLTHRIGYTAGMRFANSIKGREASTSHLELGRKCADFAQIAGWGRHEISGSIEGGEVTITVYNSPLPDPGSGGRDPVCSFQCGLLAGSASAIIRKYVIGEEVACVNKGDEFCRFVLRTRQ